jgi:hypothetical protein
VAVVRPFNGPDDPASNGAIPFLLAVCRLPFAARRSPFAVRGSSSPFVLSAGRRPKSKDMPAARQRFDFACCAGYARRERSTARY